MGLLIVLLTKVEWDNVKQIRQPTWAAEEDVSVSGRSNLPYLLIPAVTSKGQKEMLTPSPGVFTWPLLKFPIGIWTKKAGSHLALGWLQVSFSHFQMGCSSSVKPVWEHPHRTVCSKSCQADKINHATSSFHLATVTTSLVFKMKEVCANTILLSLNSLCTRR